MSEFEKVIAILERCWRHGCDKCDWRDGASGYPWSCPLRNQAEKAAIELLKVQMPRVMTVEEWKNLPEPQDGECLCYEIDDGSLQAMLTKVFTGSERLYGKAFRVWTSRPTPEQMANTPWDVSSDEREKWKRDDEIADGIGQAFSPN